jgi:hypothetical protein
MKRLTGYIPVPGTIVKEDGRFTRINVPNSFWNGKTKVRIRIVMWPDRSQVIPPIIDGVDIRQPEYDLQRTALPGAGLYVDSTISAHVGASGDNSGTGRADVVADRLVPGNYPLWFGDSEQGLACSEVPHGTHFDTAAGWRSWISSIPFERFTFNTVLCPEWYKRDAGTYAERLWILATPHPEGGVSFGRMKDWWVGPWWGREHWYCDGPALMFGGYTPAEHRAVAFIYEGSDDEVPQPYGYLYLCDACRAHAAQEGRKDVGFGGDHSANRFLKMVLESTDANGDQQVVNAFVTRYSTPATVSGRAYEYYYGHSPLHQTLAEANPLQVYSANAWDTLIRAANVPGGHWIVDGWQYSYGFIRIEEWGRNYDPRGLMGGQITLRALLQPQMRWYDPWFSDDRPTPVMLESDFLAPRQFMNSRSRLSSAYPVGEWDFPPEVVYKWKTRPDQIFNESLPVDEPLNMRYFNMGGEDAKGRHMRSKWQIDVEARHFYIGSDSATVETGKAEHTIDLYLIGLKELQRAFYRVVLFSIGGGLIGTMMGLEGFGTAINQLNIAKGRLARESRGVGGSEEKPTRYVRHQYDAEKHSHILTLANNYPRTLETTLPNGTKTYWEERVVESRFGAVPAVSGYIDPRGEVVIAWPHSKRWMFQPNINMHVRGVEDQYVVEGYKEGREYRDRQGRTYILTENKEHSGWAANPNRVHRAADFGARSIQITSDESDEYAALVWDQHVGQGQYVPYVQLIKKNELFAPRGRLRVMGTGAQAFIPSEELDLFTHEPGDGKHNRGAPLSVPVEGQEIFSDPELRRTQDWRHVYPIPILENELVLLVGDKEVLCRYDESEGDVSRVVGQSSPKEGHPDEYIPVPHIFLRVLPYSLFNPAKGYSPLIETGVFEGPKLMASDIDQGYNPTAFYRDGDVYIVYNTMEEPGRVPAYHGSAFQEYDATIIPGAPVYLRVRGAPIKQAPGRCSTKPAIQCYVSAYPARTPVKMVKLPASALGPALATYLSPLDAKGNLAKPSDHEANVVEGTINDQDSLADSLSAQVEDEPPVIARCGPPMLPGDFGRYYGQVVTAYRAYSANNPNPQESRGPKDAPPSDDDWDEWAEACTAYVYDEVSVLSRRQVAIIVYDLLMRVSSEMTALKLAMRTYWGPLDDDTRCPECGAYELFCTDIDEGRHIVGTFVCRACGNSFTDDCHYVELEYVDAAYDDSRSRIWLAGGLYTENFSTGAQEGLIFTTYRMNGAGIWAGERPVVQADVDYQQIFDEDPGPGSAKEKPYLWDTADKRQYGSGGVVRTDQPASYEVDKKPPPVEDGLEHIPFTPPHKPKLLISSDRIALLTVDRELYDVALSRMDREERTVDPGDHIASTASPVIPRIYYSFDGKLWGSDYHQITRHDPPDSDLYEAPKRDFWELPTDLKQKSGQG